MSADRLEELRRELLPVIHDHGVSNAERKHPSDTKFLAHVECSNIVTQHELLQMHEPVGGHQHEGMCLQGPM